MIKMRNFAVLLALGSVAVLPACSMGGNNGGQAAYTIPQPPGVSPAQIQHVQTRLQQEGDYSGAIDGIWGPSTEAGVRVYQQHHSLSVTGQLDAATMSSLDSAPAAAPAPAAQAAPATQPYAAPQSKPATPPAAAAPPSGQPSAPAAAPATTAPPVAPKTP